MADKVFCGAIVLPVRVIEDGFVLVSAGVVQAVGAGPRPAGEVHGGRGYLVLPGAIDAQVHSRSQLGQEDFVWSTKSAAAGGVTTIVTAQRTTKTVYEAIGPILSTASPTKCANYFANAHPAPA